MVKFASLFFGVTRLMLFLKVPNFYGQRLPLELISVRSDTLRVAELLFVLLEKAFLIRELG